MESEKWLLLSIWAVGGLLVAMAGCLIVDSDGQVLSTDGTLVSARFQEGSTFSTDIKVGEPSVPIVTENPGTWVAEIDSAALGKIEAPVDYENLYPGQHVYLDYHMGKLTRQASVVRRLQSESGGRVSEGCTHTSIRLRTE